MRKLLLTALVAGPLAVLPSPLWALPTGATAQATVNSQVQVGTTAGITYVINGNELAVGYTSGTTGIINWTNFGDTGVGAVMTIGAGDVVRYNLPTTASSILNRVAGASTTTINGSILSNGKVYIVNGNGVIIGATGVVDTAGFIASTLPDSDPSYLSSGTLPLAGIPAAGANVTLTSGGQIRGGGAAYLAGATVNAAGSVVGDLFVRAVPSSGVVGGVNLGAGGALAVTGNLDVTSKGTPVTLTAAAGNTTVGGNATIVTTSGVATTNGAVTQGASGFLANGVGKVTTINTGTSTPGAITLDSSVANDFTTITVTGGATAIKDATDLNLGGSTVAGTLAVTTTAGNITSVVNASGTANTSASGVVTLTAGGAGKAINYKGVGDTTFAAAAGLSASTVTVAVVAPVNLSSAGNVVLPGAIAGATTDETITAAGTITTTAVGVPAGSVAASNSVNLTAGGDILINQVGSATATTVNVSNTVGKIEGLAAGAMTVTTSGAVGTAATITAKTTATVANPKAATLTVTGPNGVTVSAGSLITATTAKFDASANGAVILPTGTDPFAVGGAEGGGALGVTSLTILSKNTPTIPAIAATDGIKTLNVQVSSATGDVTATSNGTSTSFVSAAGAGTNFTIKAGRNVAADVVQAETVSVEGTAGSFLTVLGASTAQAIATNGNASVTIGGLAAGVRTIGNVSATNGSATVKQNAAAGATLVVSSIQATGLATSSINVTNAGTAASPTTITAFGAGFSPTVNVTSVGDITLPAIAAGNGIKTINLKATGGKILSSAAGGAKTYVLASGGSATLSATDTITFDSLTADAITITAGSTLLTAAAAGTPLSTINGALSLTFNDTAAVGIGVPYVTGTIAVAGGSATITGTGTASLNTFGTIDVTGNPLTVTTTGTGSTLITGAVGTAVATIPTTVTLNSAVNNVTTVGLVKAGTGMTITTGGATPSATSGVIAIGAGGLATSAGAITITNNALNAAAPVTIGGAVVATGGNASITAPQNVAINQAFGSAAGQTNVTSTYGTITTAAAGALGGAGAAASTTLIASDTILLNGTVTAQNVTATSSNGMVTANNTITATGTGTFTGAGDVTINSAGGADSFATLNVTSQGARALIGGAANITATTASTIIAAYDLTLQGAGIFTAPTLGLRSDAGNISQSGGNTVVSTGVTTITSNGSYNSVNLPAANSFTTVKLTGNQSAPTISALGGATTGFTLNNTGSVSIGASVFAGPANITSTAGNITLGTAAADAIKGAWNLNLVAAGTISDVANNMFFYGNLSLAATTVNITGTGHNWGRIVTSGAAGVTGNMTISESSGLNLGKIIVGGNLTATSQQSTIANNGDLAVTGTATFSAATGYDVLLGSLNNNIGGAITLSNGAANFTLRNNAAAGTTVTATAPVTGNTVVTIPGIGKPLTMTGDFSTLGITSNGNVTVNETNALTLQNLAIGGTGNLSFRNDAIGATGGTITLGSGIAITTLGSTTFAVKGASSSIVDGTSPISILNGTTTFNASAGGGVSILNTGNVFGSSAANTVSLSTGGNAAATLKAASTLFLGNITTNQGPLTIASTGEIVQDGAAVITAATIPSVAATFTAADKVSLVGAGTNNIAGTIAVTTTGTATTTIAGTDYKPGIDITVGATSNATAPYPILLGAISTPSYLKVVGSVAGMGISQAAGATITAVGTQVKVSSTAVGVGVTDGASINLTNVNNSLKSIYIEGTGNANTDVVNIRTKDTVALAHVVSGGALGAAPITITADAGDITNVNLASGAKDPFGSTLSGIAATPVTGSAAITPLTLNATAGGINLAADANGMTTISVNTLASKDVSINNPAGSLTFTMLAPATNVTISTLKSSDGKATGARTVTLYGGNGLFSAQTLNVIAGDATNFQGTITDNGRLSVFGNTTFSTGNATAGTIFVNDPDSSFGGIKFTGGSVTIQETGAMNIRGGSAATTLSLTAGTDFNSVAGDLTVNNISGAASIQAVNITMPDVWKINGLLTVTGSTSANLGALSISGDLNSITPTNSGSVGGYTPPTP